MRRALVTLPDGVWKIIDKELKGKIGDGDSEVIRNIVITALTEKGYLLSPKSTKAAPSQLKEEMNMHDIMLSSLVEVLEEKGQVSYNEYENRVKKKIAESTSLQSRSS